MVIDMNESEVRTMEQVRQVRQVRQVLEGTQELEFRRAEDDEGCYGWIAAVLKRSDYPNQDLVCIRSGAQHYAVVRGDHDRHGVLQRRRRALDVQPSPPR